MERSGRAEDRRGLVWLNNLRQEGEGMVVDLLDHLVFHLGLTTFY